MRMRITIFGLALLGALTAKAQNKPNFIIILADDLGYGDISCYGNTHIKTPNLDQMAKDGVRFLDFHSNGAVSSPTRAALLTGKYQQRTGITGVITAKDHREVGLSLSENSVAEVLKEEGYVTGIFGKWHLGYNEKYNPIHQGFDEFIGYVSGNIDYHSHVDQEGYPDWWKADKLANEIGYSTDLISQNAIDFIIRNQGKPFLLYISHEAPHSPYQGLKSKAVRYPHTPGAVNEVDFPTIGSGKDIFPVFKEMIEILDASIGKTLNILKQLKLDNNTIVIFCSDNGAPKVGSNGTLRGGKGSVWEGGHRVPAIIQWTGHIKPGWISQEVILTMDIFPTVLELAGNVKNTEVDGVSIAKHLLYKKPLVSRTLFWQAADRYAVRKGKWKLVVTGFNAKPELYDMILDFEEKNNVADDHPDIINKLQDEFKKWELNVNKGVKKIS